LAALGAVFGCRARRRGHCVARGVFRRGVSAQSSDGIQQFAAVSYDIDAQVLQVFRRQARKNRFVDLVLAEGSLISFEAKAPQPTSEVHHGTLNGLPLMIVQPSG